MNPTTADHWQRRALFLARFTVAFNLLEGAVSLAFGWRDESLSLGGFGFDSLVEVASAVVVVWRLRGAGLARERAAVRAIAGLFLLLGASLAAGSLWRLARREAPATALPALAVSLVSLGLMAWLWRAKVRAAEALDSPALRGDAACSLACIRMSLVLLAGSLLFSALPRLWWADAAAGLGLAFLIAREGLEGWRASGRADFQGGCGCGHD